MKQHILTLVALLGTVFTPLPHGSEPTTGQQEEAANWLQLEADRKEYQSTHPTATPQQAQRQDLLLQQQGQRDRQALAREHQSSALQQQQQRLERSMSIVPHPDRGGAPNRRAEQLQLQNRLQRDSWPKH